MKMSAAPPRHNLPLLYLYLYISLSICLTHASLWLRLFWEVGVGRLLNSIIAPVRSRVAACVCEKNNKINLDGKLRSLWTVDLGIRENVQIVCTNITHTHTDLYSYARAHTQTFRWMGIVAAIVVVVVAWQLSGRQLSSSFQWRAAASRIFVSRLPEFYNYVYMCVYL